MTDTEIKLEETNNAIKELVIKLAGITMFNVITDVLSEQPEVVRFLLDNLTSINNLYSERMK